MKLNYYILANKYITKECDKIVICLYNVVGGQGSHV